MISIDENGAAAVTRGKEDKTVTLTAATASGEASSNRTFTVTVPKLLTALGTMTPETFVDANGTNLPYRLYLPADYDPDRAYPVMLFMHGAGERGTDNALQVTYNVGVIDRTKRASSSRRRFRRISSGWTPPGATAPTVWMPFRRASI